MLSFSLGFPYTPPMLHFIGQKHCLNNAFICPDTFSVKLPKTISATFTINGCQPNFAVLHAPTTYPESISFTLVENLEDLHQLGSPFPHITGNDDFEYQNGLYSLPSAYAGSNTLFGITKEDVAVCVLVAPIISEVFVTTPAIYLRCLKSLSGCKVGDLHGLEAYVEMRGVCLTLPSELEFESKVVLG